MLSFYVKLWIDRWTDRETDTGKTIIMFSLVFTVCSPLCYELKRFHSTWTHCPKVNIPEHHL